MSTMEMIQTIPHLGLHWTGWHELGWHSVGWHSVGWHSVGWHSVGWHSMSISSLMHFKLGFLHIHVPDWTLLAQQFETDPSKGIREWFANFVATGQIWAMIIGFIIGYLFRGFTSYG